MRFDIQGLGFPLTAALVDHTERRLRFALTRTGARIKRVVVRLGDTNGPRGGGDKFRRPDFADLWRPGLVAAH